VATVDTFGSDFDTLLGVYLGSAVDALTYLVGNDFQKKVLMRFRVSR